MVSGACCSPSLARTEKDLEKRFEEAIDLLDLDATVTVVSLGSLMAGKASISQEQMQLIQALFQRYGAKFAPAALIEDRVLFAGGAPTTEKLVELLKAL